MFSYEGISMFKEQFEHDEMNSPHEAAQARHVTGQAAMADPRIAQLVALFKASDERGKITLLAIAAIHSARYPKEPK